MLEPPLPRVAQSSCIVPTFWKCMNCSTSKLGFFFVFFSISLEMRVINSCYVCVRGEQKWNPHGHLICAFKQTRICFDSTVHLASNLLSIHKSVYSFIPQPSTISVSIRLLIFPVCPRLLSVPTSSLRMHLNAPSAFLYPLTLHSSLCGNEF